MMPPEQFTQRLPLADAWAWLDAWPEVADSELVALPQAFARVLSEPLLFPADRPDRDLALIDGYAVQAESTFGASSYNPVTLTMAPKGAALAAACAVICHAGEPMPAGADAVLPLDAGEAVGTMLELSDAVARGAGVGRKGQGARPGDLAIAAGCRLGVPQIALAASLGVAQLPVRRRPVVGLVLAGPKPPAVDALHLAMVALIERDGGHARCTPCANDLRRRLFDVVSADLVLVVGRSGWGDDDDAVQGIVAAGGRVDHHGLALTPGASAGLGWLAGAPLLLLPGDPFAALAVYELLAGRLLRRLAGRGAAFPHATQSFTLSRKIASPIGVSEFVPVVCRGSSAEPLAVAPADGLASYARADGFLIVPAGLEGYASGTLVNVAVMPHGFSAPSAP
jgi:molybdopterin molybdotransferase